ncbi:MAG: septal ring lytic transglycosylase RlpA family protein [Thermoanaerobaculia bacterium]
MTLQRTIASAPILVGILVLSGCASSGHRPSHAGPSTLERGVASWYGPGFDGRMTASGERYDMHALTAAHRTLPFGTLLEVRNLDNGLSTQVRINDRGPFMKERILDLSLTAAHAIGMVGPGTARVELRTIVLGGGDRRYVVQVGAFQERALADALVARLRPSYPQIALRSDEVWHRVQLGAFDDPDAAAALAAKLSRQGYSALVVAATTAATATPPAF